MTDLTTLTASELASLIRERKVSSAEVVQAHLARIEAVNEQVNAVTVVLSESALEAAKKADSGAADGPLHGVPFTIKENIDCVGTATTNGVPALAESMPTRDAPVVERMKAAGAIPIGRTNLPEMGLRLSTDNPLRGRTLNPYDPDLTAGGSSGGDAAALATGMTPFGLGNDIGGSLRNPAYCCGITSLKPTTGRIPRAGSIEPLDAGMAVQAMLVEGPMTRSVADLEVGLRVLAGRDIRDPRSVDAPLLGPAPASRRAAIVTEVPGGDVPQATVAAVRKAGDALRDAGWEVVNAEPPELEAVQQNWAEVIATDFSVLLPMIQPIIRAPLHASLQELCARFDTSNKPSSMLHAERSRLGRLWSAFFAEFPVVVGPTWTRLPWPRDADVEPGGLDVVLDAIRFITPGNVLGLPSVAMPTGLADGLPTGVQVYADLWREDLCLEAAGAIENAVGAPLPVSPAG